MQTYSSPHQQGSKVSTMHNSVYQGQMNASHLQINLYSFERMMIISITPKTAQILIDRLLLEAKALVSPAAPDKGDHGNGSPLGEQKTP